MIDIAAAVGALLNGGWVLRLESKVATLDARTEGNKELCDERHDVVIKRLERMDAKLDRLLER